MGLTDWTVGTVWATAITTWAPPSDWAAGTSWAGDGGDAVAVQQGLSVTTIVTNIASAAKYNPYADGTYGGGYDFDTNHDTGDITYTEADGKFTFDVGGVFMVDVVTVIAPTSTTTNDQELNVNGSPVWAPAINMTLNTVVSPTEVPVSLILDLTAGQFLEYFIDSVGASFNSHDGSTVTLTEVPDITGSPDVHFACVSALDSTNVNASAIFPFDKDFYPVPGTFKTHAINGTEFDPDTGRMTIKRAALYLVDICLFDVIGPSTVAMFRIRLLKNGTPIWQPSDNSHHFATDPYPRSITLQLVLDVDDFLELEIDSQDANGSGTKPGTHWAVLEMAA